MRVMAACSLGGAGHLRPLLPVLAAARRRGHETLVVGPPALQEMVEGAGWPFQAGDEPPEEEVAPIRERLAFEAPFEASVLGNRELFGRLATEPCFPRWNEHVVSGYLMSLSAIPVSMRRRSSPSDGGSAVVQVAISSGTRMKQIPSPWPDLRSRNTERGWSRNSSPRPI